MSDGEGEKIVPRHGNGGVTAEGGGSAEKSFLVSMHDVTSEEEPGVRKDEDLFAEVAPFERRTKSLPMSEIEREPANGDYGANEILRHELQLNRSIYDPASKDVLREFAAPDGGSDVMLPLRVRGRKPPRPLESATTGATSSPQLSSQSTPMASLTQNVTASDTSPQSPTAPAPPVRSLLGYGRYLMDMDFDVELAADSNLLEDAWSVATKRRGVYNLVQVPMRLERMVILGLCICADEFLSIFTFVPLRAFMALIRLLWVLVTWPWRWLIPGLRRGPLSDIEHRHCTRVLVGNVIDILHVSTLVFTALVLGMFDISWIYHNIRGQSVIKLYVVFNVMEIFDRLCCSFGVDILDSLGWTTASAVSFFSRSAKNAGSSITHGSKPVHQARALQGVALLTRVAFDYMFTVVYVSLHATLLLTWVVTLNVAINTQNNALLTLLVSNNFVELKGSVFKSFKVQNLFQVSCSDAIERFQLTVFLALMLVYSSGDHRLLTTWGVVYLCEVIVDWIKHAFVTKFNRITHRVYQQFSLVICNDIVQAKKHSVVRSIGGSAVAKRLGFVSLPLGALVIRMTGGSLQKLPLSASAIITLIMFMSKIALSIGLTGHAMRRVKRNEIDRGDAPQDEDEDMNWSKTFVRVGKYDVTVKK